MPPEATPVPRHDYRRVAGMIENDSALSRHLGAKTITVERRNGSDMFAPELIDLADAMVQAGFSLQSCPKPQTLRFAMQFFAQNGVAPPPPALPKATLPLSPPGAKAPRRKAEPEEPKKDDVRKAIKPESKTNFCATVALANLAMSMLQLAEQYDTLPGSEKRREKLNALASEYEKQTKEYLEGCWVAAQRNA